MANRTWRRTLITTLASASVFVAACTPDSGTGSTETTTTTSTTTSTSTTSTTSTTLPPVTDLHINEVESSGGTPGDWVELVNVGTSAIDLTGWSVLDNDNTHTPAAFAPGTSIAAGGYLVVEEAALGFGLGSADSVRLFDQTGSLYETTSWTAHAATTWGRCPNGTGAFTATTSSTKAAINDCSSPIRVNEVESSGGSPGDWIELINPSALTIDVSGYVVKDNDDTHNYTIASGTSIAAGGYLVVEEAALGFGLGSSDSARVWDATGNLIDSTSWTAHAATTWGRCPNGTGAFTTTNASTKAAVNSCPGDIVTVQWPGESTVATADTANLFGTNMSGLAYEGSGSSAPGVLWAVKNGPGTLYQLVADGSGWTPATTNDWGSGKALHYTDGTGNPDAEAVTFTSAGSAGGIFVGTERNNDANTVSRTSILRFDPSAAGTSLTATTEWNLTADLPTVGANLGIEALTWVPDTALVAAGFRDQNTGLAYSPANYANHGDGLFFVGLEANGSVYAYALDQTSSSFTRIATIASGFSGVMELSYDAELGNLWAVCDDGCFGRSTVLRVNSSGAYVPTTIYDRPTGMANLNNEGFTFAPLSECVSDRRPAFWSDDNNTDGHAIRVGSISCSQPTP